MDTSVFQRRRNELLARMGTGIALISTAPECLRNRDSHYPYRADSYFYYLTGFTEPEAVLVLIADKDSQKSILFCRDKNLDKEIWDGFRWGPDAARETFGFDEAKSITTLDAELPRLLANQPALHYSLGHDTAWDTRITAALNAVRTETRAGKHAPAEIRDVRVALDAMRLIKDAHEIALLRRAASISASAHRRAMRFCAPEKFEYEIEAELLHEFRSAGCQAPAYPSIVAGGVNACILHYTGNNQILRNGDLLLIDAGGEYDGYAGDITRTFPVNGRFSGPQKDVYDLVLNAQLAAIAAISPGASFYDPHAAALKVLVQGMIDLKLLHGDVDTLIESEAYKRFYMHRSSHWLGLDVHDAGEYKQGDTWKTLVPGMTLTVEPGCYIRAADDVPASFHNIGVRIEDDVLITTSGNEILTLDAPKQIAEIELLMREARKSG